MQQTNDLYGRAEGTLERAGLFTKPADDPLPPGSGDARKILTPKDFYWDRIVTILVTGILGLTFVDVVAEFFRQPSSTVLCNTPSNFTRDQTAFVNSFCFNSLPSAQYYTLFITVHGLLLIAPHQLWTWLFTGYVEYFFDLAKSLDRLKNSKTGDYASKNTAIVTKLEKEFLSEKRWIFALYKLKLILQLAAAAGSLAVMWTLFNDFTVVFSCAQNGSSLCTDQRCSFDDAWPASVDCAYIPLQLLSVLRYVDMSLVSLVILVLLYGIAWCFQGHPTELGADKMALFAFTSCLLPETYVFPSPWSSVVRRGWRGIGRGLCSPRIRNDLDFLLLQLFQADSGHGQVFKEIQVAKEYKRLYARDHELLHLFVNLQQDMRSIKEIKQRQQKGGLAVTNEGEGLAITNEEVVIQQDTVTQVGVVLGSAPGEGHPRRSLCGGVCCCKGSRKGSGSEDDSDSSDEDMFQRRGVGGDRSSVRKRKRKTKLKGQREGESSKPDRYQDELRSYFKNAGFDDADDPEKVAYLDYKPDLGNTKWTDVQSIRSRFYGFVQFAPDNDVAVDISFGSIGFTLALARAFRTAMSMNLHEFYKEDEPKKQSFYTNYYTFMFPQDLFSRSNLVLNKANECICEEFRDREHKISFIVVGPIDDQSKITTVNLLINTLYTTKYIEEGAILLAVRPLQIEHKVTADKYYRYKPSKSLFSHTYHRDTVQERLVAADSKSKKGIFSTVTVGGRKHRGLRIKCADTECVFQFKTYRFNPEGYDSGKRKGVAPQKGVPVRRSDGSSSSSSSTPIDAHPVPPAGAIELQSSTEETAVVRSGDSMPSDIVATRRVCTDPRMGYDDDHRALVTSEEETPLSPHDSNKYAVTTTSV